MSGDLLALASRRVLSDRTEPRSPIKPSRSSSRRKRTIRPKPVTRTQNKAYPSPLNHLRRSSTPPVLGFLHRSHILKSGERSRRAASLSHRKQRGYGRRIAAAGLGSFVRRTKPPRGRFPPVCVRLFVGESTPGAPLLELGSFFQFSNPARLFRANCGLGSFFQPETH